MAQRRLIPLVLNMDDRQPRAKIKSLEDSLSKLNNRSNAPTRPRLSNPFNSPAVVKADKEAMRAANEIMRINNQTMRLSMQNDRLLERAARQLADVRVRESKRAADAMLKSLNDGRRGTETATKGIGGSFSSIFGGSFLGNMAANAMSRVVGAVKSGVEEIISEGVRLATEMENALKGLSSVATFKGVSEEDAQDAVRNLRFVRGGIISVSDASIALKNLLASGFSLPEATTLVERFSDAAAFGKQAALGYGQAIAGASEGIKNQNSLLVDNVGITKNLSVIMKERGFELQDISDKMKGAAARQALYNGLLVESQAQVGDADKVMRGYTGTIAAQDVAYQNLERAIGGLIIRNPAIIESSKIVAEQFREQTDEINNSNSATNDFAEDAIKAYGKIKANAIPAVATIANLVRVVSSSLGVIATAAVGAISWMLEQVADAFLGVGNTIVNGVKIVINGVVSALQAAGIDKLLNLQLGKLEISAPSKANFGSEFMFGKTKEALDDVVKTLQRVADLDKQREVNALRIDFAMESRRQEIEAQRRADRMSGINPFAAAEARRARAQQLADSVASTSAGVTANTAGTTSEQAKKLKKAKEVIDEVDNWSISELRDVQEFFKQRTGKVLPVTALGQTRTHNRMGLDHRNAADVGLNPNSAEGQLLLSYLKANDIPHRALTKADKARGVKMTAPHIHIGEPSRGFGANTRSLGLTRGSQADDSTTIMINGQVARVSAAAIYTFQSLAKAMADKMRAEPLTAETGLAGPERLTTQLTSYAAARKAIDDQLGEQAVALYNRQKNFAFELNDVWREAALARGNREMDLMRTLEESESHLYNLRAENSDAHLVDLRRENMVRREQVDLAQTLSDLQDENATMGSNAALRYSVEWQRAINEVKRADFDARDSMIRSQVQIADKTVYHANQANARVMEFLAAQKGVTDIVADAKIGVFQETYDLIDDGLDRIIPKLGGVGDLLKQIIADLLKMAASKQLAKLFGLGTGESSTGTSGGGGGFLNALRSLFGGGGNGSGGGGGFVDTLKGILGFGSNGGAASALTGGFAGGASPAASLAPIFSAAGTGAALFGGATTAATAAPLALSVAPGAGIASIFGAGSAAGLFGGGTAATGAATTGAAAGSGLSMASLAAFASNPITLAVAGAAIGGFMLWRHFRNGTEKKLRKAIKSVYGVDIKDMKLLSQIKQLGEQAFGRGNVGKHLMETIRLDGVKELIMNYAEQTGQQATGLTTNSQYGDPSFRENQFVRGGAGGEMDSINAGRSSVPQSSSDSDNSSSAVMSRYGAQAQRGGVNGMVGAAIVGVLGRIMEVQDKLEKKIGAASAGQVVTWAKDQNPEAFVDGFNEAMSRGHKKDETLTNLGFRNG